MKALLFLFFYTMLFYNILSSQETQTTTVADEAIGTVTVHLSGLESDEGQLMVALYDSKEKWLDKFYKGELVKIDGKQATVVFKEVPYGIYAISAVHDKDNNNKLNTGFMGIPTEPYANSRGAFNRFGPPKWDNAKFELKAAQSSENIVFR